MLTKALGSRSDELLTISVARVTSSSVASHERDGIVSRSKRPCVRFRTRPPAWKILQRIGLKEPTTSLPMLRPIIRSTQSRQANDYRRRFFDFTTLFLVHVAITILGAVPLTLAQSAQTSTPEPAGSRATRRNPTGRSGIGRRNYRLASCRIICARTCSV